MGSGGLAVKSWYDHKKLDRISADLLRYVEHAIEGVEKRGSSGAERRRTPLCTGDEARMDAT